MCHASLTNQQQGYPIKTMQYHNVILSTIITIKIAISIILCVFNIHAQMLMNVQVVHTTVINNVITHLVLMSADVIGTTFLVVMDELAQVSSKNSN